MLNDEEENSNGFSKEKWFFHFINNQKNKQPGWNRPKSKQLTEQPRSLKKEIHKIVSTPSSMF